MNIRHAGRRPRPGAGSDRGPAGDIWQQEGISRRQFVSAGAAGAGVLLGRGVTPAIAATNAHAASWQPSREVIPCDGEHQAGVTTPMQRHLQLAGFDVSAPDRTTLGELLRAWQGAIELLTSGSPLSQGEPLSSPPADTGEAAGQTAARLTITIGFGGSLFDRRFGLQARRPPALIDLPAFSTDSIDATRSNGDISVQACADQPLVAEHAIRDLARIAQGVASLRWLQSGFDDPPTQPTGTGRNLLGFKDGTANLDPSDEARMRRNVWVAPGDGPRWMQAGTYQVYRRVALHIEKWDGSVLDEQQDTFGRYKANGAPYGASSEFAPVVTSLLPSDSHVRLANPRTGQASEDERILRRGYSFTDGYDTETGAYDYGLAFIAYQRDPRRQFLSIQQRLSEHDALNEYVQHTASGVFAIPPGARPGGFPGEQLLTAR
ncbi:MAG TPA: iron uptake transporter deferrochelatase/peroxidase subunit [Solirubrobacteraceae bacterium]|nr:iron uptake transporter deferrochelatase/peroxidase subunit [Solirubrobacteraceae bacterium]